MLKTIKHAAIIALVAGAAAVAAPSSYASTKGAQFDVTLNLQNDCSISANSLDFGSNGTLTNNIDVNSSLAVTCTKGTTYDVALDSGTAPDSTVLTRRMVGSDGTSTVDYGLFRDVARTQNWGNTQGTDTVSRVGTGDSQSIPVYGRVPPQSTPAAGTYHSTVTATVIF
ncbi:spore coat U domain-containing protein [Caballeronia sp. BR00000012568055]|uniref:Csu type fimbrial protein n=1 Tax=Caballeronia sp. BR00000012568055 TaxID=2918761 RepID=UPI0023F6CCE3|nr:spore coat U domain-containing protein [Caballeronia sp. BR00000012568055]